MDTIEECKLQTIMHYAVSMISAGPHIMIIILHSYIIEEGYMMIDVKSKTNHEVVKLCCCSADRSSIYSCLHLSYPSCYRYKIVHIIVEHVQNNANKLHL